MHAMLYTQGQVNLHTHSFYCGHGAGELIDFADVAKQKGHLKVLGFSEHCPVPYDDMPSRMSIVDLEDYINDVKVLKNANDGLVYLLGAECDWIARYVPFYRDFILEKKQFDYVIGAVHFLTDHETGELKYIPHMKEFNLKDLSLYCKWYTQMIESRLFIIGCHPDLFFGGYRKWDEEAKAVSKDIIACAKDNDITLELNDLGLRKKMIETDKGLRHQYSIPEFWELASDAGVRICTNTDAHTPDAVCGNSVNGFINQSFEFASELGIKFVHWEIAPESDRICAVPNSLI